MACIRKLTIKCKLKTAQQRKEVNGITLIALVVTIVVLLILAGVTITMVLGEDGIIAQAKLAAEKTKEAEEQQERDLQDLAGMINEAVNGKDPDKLEDAVSNHKVFSKTTGYDSDGNKVDGSNEAKKAVITIPAGFKIIEGSIEKLNEGVVISDEAGNEFVWVPCTVEQYKKHDYRKRESNDDERKNVEDDNDGGWNTYSYTKYSDWTGDTSQESKNKESVEKYGGFYIARYEAGIPSNATGVYVSADSSSAKAYTYEGNKNVTTFKPVSKKGVQAWNYIDQTHAKAAAERMYSGNRYVTSQLVDGIARDTIVEWIAKDESLSDVVKKDSTKKGNYANNDSTNGNSPITVTNILYAEHIMIKNVGWAPAKNYKYGTFTSGWKENYTFTDTTDKKENYNNLEENGGTYNHYVEMATGVSDNTKLKNIYDLGGNMYEWTTETGYHDTNSETQYAVLRGGSFYSHGVNDPVSIRLADHTVDTASPDIGFRVVLYVK